MRVGHGYDVHAFGSGKRIVIGGVSIPHYYSLVAHSDGDVLIHSLCDALLGALGEGDIGRHFPDDDESFSGSDSRCLLRRVVGMMQQHGFRLGNADMTLIAQVPKFSPYIEEMCANLALDLEVAPPQINIKATTTERLGFIGREEGIAAHAVVLLLDG